MLVLDPVQDSNESSLPLICAIIDLQGFFVEKKFFPRIITVNDGNCVKDYEFDPLLPSLSAKDEKTVNFLQYKFHGYSKSGPAPDTPGNFSFLPRQLVPVLKTIYTSVASQDKPYFGVANNHLASILKEELIPFVDLTVGSGSAPSHKQLDLKYKCDWICSKHIKSSTAKFICSKRKVTNLWKWLQESNHINVLVNKMIKTARQNHGLLK